MNSICHTDKVKINNHVPVFSVLKKGVIMLLFLGSFFTLKSLAQVNMTRTVFDAPYTPISVAGGATASPNGVLRTNIPIGFVFNYLGNNFINLSASIYGYVCLGSTSAGGTPDENINMYTNSSSFPANILAPYAEYCGSSSAVILYQTQGAAGSRTFTIQWTDINSYNTTGTRNFINFQIILYEGTNVIEFRYGYSTVTTPNTNESASILIRSTGGNDGFIDATTGLSRGFYAMVNSGSKWPIHHYRFTPGLPTPIPTGTYNVGMGQTYRTIEEATSDLNHRGVSGPVVFNLTDTLYEYSAAGGYNQFPVIIGPVNGASSTNTITFTSAVNSRLHSVPTIFNCSAGNEYIHNPSSNGPVINNTRDVILTLMGSKYVTVENIRLTTGNTNATAVDRGILLTNMNNSTGAQNNTIKNVNISLRGISVGIDQYSYYSGSYTHTAAGTSSNNKYLDLNISNVSSAIYFYSPNNYRDSNNVIGTTSPSVYNQFSATSQFGIYCRLQKNITIFNTEIRNNNTAVTYDGMYFEQVEGKIKIYNNKIHDLAASGSTTTSFLSGIRIFSTSNIDSVRIYNNFIYGINSTYSGTLTGTIKAYGISLPSITGSVNIDHNSVAITGPVNASSTALSTGTGSVALNIRNNILANYTPAQTSTAYHYAWTGSTFTGTAASVIDNNNFYIANPPNGFIAGTSTNHSTLGSLQSASGKNLNSVVTVPPFVNYLSDLHLNNTSYNGTGTNVPTITTDIDGDPRANPPSIGADEYLLLPCSSADAGTISATSSSFCEGLTTSLTATGASNAPGITYQWKVSSSPGGPYLNVTGGAGATTSSYTTALLTPGTYYFIFEATCANGPSSDLSNEVMVTVNPKPSVTVNATEYIICRGTATTLHASGADTYTWLPGPASGSSILVAPLNTTTYTVTGTQTSTGCNNTTTVAIQVNALPVISASATPSAICAGGSTSLTASGANTYSWMPGALTGTTVTVSPSSTTTYTVTGTDAGTGCTNTATRTVIVNLPNTTNVTISACNSYTLNSATYNSSGNYTQTLTNRFGCDSVINLNLTIKHSSSSTQTVTRCDSYTWPVNGTTYTNSTIATHTIPNSVGCDSVITLNLTIKHSTSATQNISACNSYTWPVNGNTYTNSITTTHTIPNSVGCDSVITLNLVIKHSTSATQNISACNSYTWPVNGTTYTNSTTTTHTIPNSVGCDSVITLNLTIKHSTAATQNITHCDSYTWPVNGTTYTTSTTTTHTIPNSVGCDSVITLNLTIKHSTSATQNISACNTYTWPLNGTTYTNSVTTTHTIPNSVGCDSVITLNLTIKHSTAATQNITHCDSYTWPVNGTTYTTSTTTTHTIPNSVGCDSVITLNLTIKHSTSATQNISACNSYTWPVNGTTYTNSTTTTHTIPNSVGCDSAITLNLVIKHSTSATQNITQCDSYTWPVNGNTYTNSTTTTYTIPNSVGCDSVITLNLTIKHSTSATQNISACNSYTWPVNGTTYINSTTTTHTIPNFVGCDSVITLNLVIKHSTAATQNITQCDSYTWPVNGNTYTNSTTTTYTIPNSVGCDSVITLNLTINHSTSATQTITQCDSYTWPVNGTTYTNSTIATHTIPNSVGCDSVITLNLVIKHSTSATQNITQCDSYTWPVNGNTYTNSTTTTHTIPNSVGCDSVITLNLSINHSTSATQNVTQCDSYTWPVNGTTYTNSTIATHTIPNSVGCDSVITLNLTINHSTSATQNVTECNSYTWPVNGNTYTNSTSVNHTIPNSVGCDSVITLNLTINHSTSATQNVTECNSYTWPVNGTTYTNSTITTHTIPNSVGCDSVITLNLTINHSTSATQNVTQCDSYTWPVNGTTYTNSTIATHTIPNSVGCDSVITLNLTINHSTSATQNVTECNSYTWPVNGITYTNSTTATHTIPNSVGCDSVITLNLTIHSFTINVLQNGITLTADTGADSYQWIDCSNGNIPVAGATNPTFTATLNGSYAVVANGNGCSDTSDCFTINSVGIEENTKPVVTVYPNPTTGWLNIKISATINTQVVLMDMTGKIVLTTSEFNADNYQVDLTTLNAGVYILQLHHKDSMYNYRIVKK